jgi:hypothetical protein
LWYFHKVCDILVLFVAIWYRFSWFGMLCEEKFGNPGCLLHPACIPVFLPATKLGGKPFLTPLKKVV